MVKKPIDSQGWAHTAHLGLIGLGISPILFSLLHTIILVSFDIGGTECPKNYEILKKEPFYTNIF